MQDLEEKKEEVIMQYKLSYDLEIAMMKVDLTSEEKKLLQNDTSFMYRIDYQDSCIRERIMATMIDNLSSPDDKLAQKAAIDLGNVLWKEKFKGKDEGPKSLVPDTIILKGVYGKTEE